MRTAIVVPSCVWVVIGLTVGFASAQTPIGAGFTYQGQIQQNGQPLAGPTADLEFRLFDDPNAGSQIGNLVSLPGHPVTEGLFTALLNATGEFGPDAFNGQARWLQISVNGQPLAARQPLTAAPYGLYSLDADLLDGQQGEFYQDAGHLNTGTLADARLSANVALRNAANTFSLGPQQMRAGAPGNIALIVGNYSVSSTANLQEWRSGLGGFTVAAVDPLGVFRGAGLELDTQGTPGVLIERDDGAYVDTQATLNISSSGGPPGLRFRMSSDNGVNFNDPLFLANSGAVGLGTTNPQSSLHVLNSASLARVRIESTDAGPGGDADIDLRAAGNKRFVVGWDADLNGTGAFRIFNGTLSQNVLVIADATGEAYFAGTLGIGAGNNIELRPGYVASDAWMALKDGGAERITFAARNGSTGAGGLIEVKNNSTSATVRLVGDSTGDGRIELNQDDGTNAVDMRASSSGGADAWMALKDSGAERITFAARNGGTQVGGLIDVKNSLTNSTLRLVGDAGSGEGRIEVRDGGTDAITLNAENWAGSGGLVTVHNNAGEDRVYLVGDDSGSGAGSIAVLDANGAYRISLDANTGYTTTPVLQITGGSDLSEQFDVSLPTVAEDANASSRNPEPGSVVCIDPQNPGKLVVSARAYDKTVAGVISGAGDVKPGLVMGQQGTVADGQHPVALAGRVWVKCDASGGPIEPGDLLTTSDIPGHAMKAADPMRTPGAVLGKAMTLLGQDRGLVLVLVSLQ